MIGKYLLSGINFTLFFVTCLGGVVISLSAQQTRFLPSSDSSQLSDHQVKQTGKLITVKILSNGFLGTGTLIKKQGEIYTVITNDHVLNASNPPYQIQTPDSRIYPAKISQNVKFRDHDLGLLQFSSEQTYQIATMGNSSRLTVGDKVFTTGFTNESKEIIFTKGNVSLVLDKPLEGSYQLGYTNDINKGMSGGPVLNIQSELVGINGLHKNPLWEAPDLYIDGSQPCKPVQEMIVNSSWGIPIETVARLAPQFVQIKPPQLLILSNDSGKFINYNYLNNLQMQVDAVTAKSCKL